MNLTDMDEVWLRAALLSHYDMPWLGVDGDLAESSGAALFPESTRVRTGDGERHWRLNDSTRRTVVRRFPFDRLRSTWSRISHRPADDRQWAIDQYVGAAEPVALDTLDLRRLRAVAWLVRWLGDAAPHIPGSADLAMHLGLGELLEPLRALAGDHFIGRNRELERLAGEASEQPVFVHGIGGVGKSALAVRYLLSAVDTSLVAYLNFDHSALDPAKPASMIASVASQLTAQLDDPRAAALATECHERLRSGKVGDTLRLLYGLVDVVADRPIVIVFDTYEEVQRRDTFVQRGFAEFLAELWERLPRRSVVLAGRAPAPDLRVEHIALTGLDPGDATGLLCRMVPGLSTADASARIRQVGSTSPLVIHLMAGVLTGDVRASALRDITVHRGAIEGELYRRLLGHIRDPDLRRIAHPGLTLRRVTPDLIKDVLAKPCGVRVHDSSRATELFVGLAHEAALVSRTPDGSAVVHRADVRRMMLGKLAEDDPEAVRRIHRAAVRFYRVQEGTTARAEELYHRLMLGQSKAVLDRYWDQTALAQLISSVEELPPASRAYLAAKSDALAVSEEDIRQAELDVRRRLLVRRVSGMLEVDEALEALDEIDNHTRQTGDTALSVVDVKVRALQRLERYGEARALAVEARERAARIGATRDFVTFTVHMARMLARENLAAEAKPDLLDTLEYCRSLPATQPHLVDRLTVLVCLLQLRRSGLPLGDTLVDELKVELIDLAEAVPAKDLTANHALLRGMAAEAGEQSHKLLSLALRTFGPPRAPAVVDLGTSSSTAILWDDPRVGLQVDVDSDLHRDDRGVLAAAPHSTLPVWTDRPTGLVFLTGPTGAGKSAYQRGHMSMSSPWLGESGATAEMNYELGARRMAEGRSQDARRLLRQALTMFPGSASSTRTTELYARSLLALSQIELGDGRLVAALELVDRAVELVGFLETDPAMEPTVGMVFDHKARVLHHQGDLVQAIAWYDVALGRFDPHGAARVLLNRGLAYLGLHRAAAADRNLAHAMALAREQDQGLLAATAAHRLGDLRRLTGDIPDALRLYESAARDYARLDTRLVPGLLLDQAKALLAAGAADEAQRLLDEALPGLRQQGDGHLVADAELTMASARLLTREFQRAAQSAASASRRFARRGETAWAEVARLAGLRADFEIERQRNTPKPGAISRADKLADRLYTLDLRGEAAIARMIAARLALASGDVEQARYTMTRVRRLGPRTPVDEVVLHRLCRAEIAMATRDFRRASAQIRAGLAELDRTRRRMAGLDLLSGTALHGWELGQLAIEMAVTRGNPRDVFTWLERSRAQTYRFRVQRDSDTGLAEVLAELRLLSNSQPSKPVTARIVELEREVARRAASSSSLSSVRPAASFAEVAERLGEKALISFVDSRDSLSAVVIVGGRARFVHLGSMVAVTENARRLHADLNAYAPDHLVAPLAEAVAHSARRTSAALDGLVMSPLAELVGNRDLVIVPTGVLYSVPWGTLPSLTGRSVVVTPSATSWLTAQDTVVDRTAPVVLVQGVGLSTYIGEVQALSAFHPNARVLVGQEATVGSSLTGMEGTRLAHVAAHGEHEPGNALFSKLELADGPLFAHDLVSLRRPPHQVVLAASELALSNVRPGDEALGFAGVLLATGVATVVAAVNRIGDTAAASAMYELHRSLAAGVPMATALADATSRDPLRRPFICLGSGG
nr:CHAT domain-containing protein [Kibdelosporangium sp. MJ126-NF4]CEL14459.1 Tetratricopeptide TPR_4 [Kibdelosporangium sp. MJ126-NF4]CTQ88824.1 Tetratricopeptide TPR_4 [Kibdelosporangium sp. MJ126-NF4]